MSSGKRREVKLALGCILKQSSTGAVLSVHGESSSRAAALDFVRLDMCSEVTRRGNEARDENGGSG